MQATKSQRAMASLKAQQQLQNTFPRQPLPFEEPNVPNLMHGGDMDLFSQKSD